MTEIRLNHISFLSLGSNIGDRLAHLRFAVSEMNHFGAVKSLSAIFETEPWGYDDPMSYLNLACRFDTNLDPQLLRGKLSAIETRAGRTKHISGQDFSARTLDIDILLYDSRIINTPDLEVPHPRMTLRRFVLEPLAQIAPDFIHPNSGHTIMELLKMTTDKSSISLYRNEF